MTRALSRLCFLGGLFAVAVSPAQDRPEAPVKPDRPVTGITPQSAKPSVQAIVPLDDTNVFFLNKRGQVGVAKFSPGLSLIAWEYYSEVKWNALPFLAQGPGYSVVLSSPGEITQAFDRNEDVELDFFQALIRDWPGKDRGSVITAGPVADPYGRLLFAISAPAPLPPEEGAEAVAEKASLIAWHPKQKTPVIVTESKLPVDAFAVDRNGLLAARLSMPEYRAGFFVSLTQLPPFDPEAPEAVPDSIPLTLPSLLIPAELTKNESPTQLAFFNEDGREKLAVVCPGSRHIIEVTPSAVEELWGGGILLRHIVEAPIETVVEMGPGELLAGGPDGFVPLNDEEEKFRITRLDLTRSGIALSLNREVDRFEAVKPENYLVQAVSLNGGERKLDVAPVVESDGRAVLLRTGPLPEKTVIRIICHRLPSADGAPLLSNAAFYTIQLKPDQ